MNAVIGCLTTSHSLLLFLLVLEHVTTGTATGQSSGPLSLQHLYGMGCSCLYWIFDGSEIRIRKLRTKHLPNLLYPTTEIYKASLEIITLFICPVTITNRRESSVI